MPLLARMPHGGSVSPEEVVNAWMNSEGHRANILDPEARAMGVGYYYNSSSTWGHQWIQLFIEVIILLLLTKDRLSCNGLA